VGSREWLSILNKIESLKKLRDINGVRSAGFAPALWVPWELWMYILDRPELKGCSGILRMVCKDWEKYIKSHKSHIKEAVRTISLLSFSLSKLSLPKSRVCQNAAIGGHLSALRWARENGCPWDEMTCAYAAEEGHLDILKWARKNGCPWDEETCALAARGGHLDVLRWARENGCPWDKYTRVYAALGDHLHVLKWARENGCPWDEWTCRRFKISYVKNNRYTILG